MWKKIDLIGKKKGKITIIECVGKNKRGAYRWKYRCDCGTEAEIESGNFQSATGIRMCLPCARKLNKTVTYDYKHPLYSIWIDIKKRCYNNRCEAYKNYGGRGVVVGEEWINNYQAFYDWAMANGWRKGLFVDKDTVGTGLIYDSNNCAIITRIENNQTRRSVKLSYEVAADIRTSSLSVKELMIKYGVSDSTIRYAKKGKSWK